MPVYHASRTVFVWIPKCGGSAINADLGGGSPSHEPWWYYLIHHPAAWHEYRRVAVVRDPIDRLRSLYYFARQPSSMWHDNTDPTANQHPDHDLCRAHSLEELVLDDRLFARLRHGWQPQTWWTGNPPRVEIVRWAPPRCSWHAVNATAVDDPAAGALGRRALRRAVDRYASSYDAFGFDRPRNSSIGT